MPQAHIVYDADFLLTAQARYRRQHPGRLISKLVRLVGFVVFLAAAGIFFWLGEPIKGAGALALFSLAAFSRPIQDWTTRRDLAKSPYNEDELILSFDEQGFHATSKRQDLKLAWKMFTKVAHFRDGYLLFQGPKIFNWIPFASMEETDQSNLDRLLRTHIEEHRVVERGH